MIEVKIMRDEKGLLQSLNHLQLRRSWMRMFFGRWKRELEYLELEFPARKE
jgi:hypothetical protein